MPRKTRPPVHLYIEGLSDGSDPTLRDELGSGEPIKQYRRVPISHASIKARAEQARAEAGRAILAKAGFAGFAQPRLVAPTKPGERLIGTINGKALLLPAKPWRRI